jgi:hypothetical protein
MTNDRSLRLHDFAFGLDDEWTGAAGTPFVIRHLSFVIPS